MKRPFLRIGAASALALALVIPTSLPALADPAADAVLIAPTAVQVASGENTKQFLTDGDTTGALWASPTGAANEQQWIQYDLGDAYTLDSLDVYWEGASSTRYLVVGWDAADAQWTQLKTVTNTQNGNRKDTVTGLAKGDRSFRYVGLAIEKLMNSDWGAKIYELQVFGHDPIAADEAAPTKTPLEYAGKPAVPAGAVNLSRLPSATVTASSASLPAANAIDGDPATRWQAQNSDTNESITIDLGGTASVQAITLDPESAYASKFTVQTSVNGWNDWTTFATVTEALSEHTIVMPENGPATARYVRLQVDARGGIALYGTSYYEFALWGDGASFVPAAPAKGEGQDVGTLLSYGKPVIVEDNNWETTGQADNKPSNITDDDLNTRWATNPSLTWQNRGSWNGHSWVVIDLGAEVDAINQVSMRWNPAHASGYGLYVAGGDTMPNPAQLTEWTEAYKTASGKGKRDTVNLPDSSVTDGARWLLFDLTAEGPAGDGNRYGYSLWEVRVFGDAGADFPINTRPADPNKDASDPDFDNLVTVWEDTFDGPAGQLPSSDNWTIDPAPAGQNNAELQAYTSSTDNIALDGNGNLVIQAIKNADGTYTSGRINSSRKAHAQFGRIEARAQVPAGQGLWPAFWMMGENFLDGTTWPTNGEIDIMEVLGHEPDTLHNTIHGPGYSGMNGVGGSFKPKDADGNPIDLSAGFHTYGVDWDSTGLRFWLDDPGYVTRTIKTADIEDQLGFSWVYDQPFFMILNLAVGGDWPGSPNANTQFPARMVVDTIRVSQSAGSGQLRTNGFSADPRDTTTTIAVTDSFSYGAAEQAAITVSTPTGAKPTGYVNVTLNGETTEVRLKDGKALFPLPVLTPGAYTLGASFHDASFALKDSSGSASFTVVKATPEVDIDLGPATIAGIEPVVAVVRLRLGGIAFPTGDVTVAFADGAGAGGARASAAGADADADAASAAAVGGASTVTLTADDYGVAVLRLPPRATTGDTTATITYAGDDNVEGFTTTAVHSTRAAGEPGTPGNPGTNGPGTGSGPGSGNGSGGGNGAGSGSDPATSGSGSSGSSTAGGTASGPLSSTGAMVGPGLFAAAVLLVGGLALALATRRRRGSMQP
ncbi:discoidin domain-containing protein [Plantibacter sp. Mn2098]|uniref:discoidin domain-containing protein n=1 Tax=Plantibacter sp. Mn2098 TaxID=3395266 RepID=UPI003BEBEE23